MADKDTLLIFEKVYCRRCCTVQRREYDWLLIFGDAETIAVSAPWRIIQDDQIALAARDDGQRFGLTDAIDGEARANALLAERRIERVELDRITADLRLHFDGRTRIDIFNDSSGYEGWQAAFRDQHSLVSIVGAGGGKVAVIR